MAAITGQGEKEGPESGEAAIVLATEVSNALAAKPAAAATTAAIVSARDSVLASAGAFPPLNILPLHRGEPPVAIACLVSALPQPTGVS